MSAITLAPRTLAPRRSVTDRVTAAFSDTADVPAHDPKASAQFLADILGWRSTRRWRTSRPSPAT